MLSDQSCMKTRTHKNGKQLTTQVSAGRLYSPSICWGTNQPYEIHRARWPTHTAQSVRNTNDPGWSKESHKISWVRWTPVFFFKILQGLYCIWARNAIHVCRRLTDSNRWKNSDINGTDVKSFDDECNFDVKQMLPVEEDRMYKFPIRSSSACKATENFTEIASTEGQLVLFVPHWHKDFQEGKSNERYIWPVTGGSRGPGPPLPPRCFQNHAVFRQCKGANFWLRAPPDQNPGSGPALSSKQVFDSRRPEGPGYSHQNK